MHVGAPEGVDRLLRVTHQHQMGPSWSAVALVRSEGRTPVDGRDRPTTASKIAHWTGIGVLELVDQRDPVARRRAWRAASPGALVHHRVAEPHQEVVEGQGPGGASAACDLVDDLVDQPAAQRCRGGRLDRIRAGEQRCTRDCPSPAEPSTRARERGDVLGRMASLDRFGDQEVGGDLVDQGAPCRRRASHPGRRRGWTRACRGPVGRNRGSS